MGALLELLQIGALRATNKSRVAWEPLRRFVSSRDLSA
jgi:hypothetical protein